jgi:LuxR family maltose regulon positive regulatory protein
LVQRDRLTPRLRAAAGASVLLVSAPPGFGKTTTLTSWLSADPDTLRAWVSLDEEDRDPASFWRYVVAALNRAAPDLAAGIAALLDSGQLPSAQLLTALVNEIGDQPQPVLLVLDDYHLADGPAVAEGMTFLIDHRPDNLHVAIGTRADPDLPLPRLRARGELVEVRTRDLRFNAEEAADYLTRVHGLTLDLDGIAELATRTEGWAAALQLAALSLQGREDPNGFVADFAGTDRFVVDYLAEEVLTRQPEHVRRFLTRTSILDILTADLCDAVTDEAGGLQTLRDLDRGNVFLVPLDDQRHWYRYHHLFADVLRAHLHEREPDLVPVLHRRAAGWFACADEPAAAVRHALAGNDPDRAADIAEAAIPALRRDRREANIRSWVGTIPTDAVRARPVLALGLIGALMSSNEFSDVDRRLRLVEEQLPAIQERIIDPQSATETTIGIIAVDVQELARVPAGIDLYRAGMALVTGDLPGTHAHAARAIAAAVPDDDLVRAGATGLAGLAHWATGDLAAAHDNYLSCIDGLHRAGHLADVLGCTQTLADLRAAQGRLREADKAFTEGLALVASGGAPIRGAADMHAGRARIDLERGDMEAARESLAAAQRLGEQWGLPQYSYRSRAVTALLAEDDGDFLAALDLWGEAERVYLGDFSPDVAPLAAHAARTRIRRGDVEGARRWAIDRGLEPGEPVSYLREFELVTLAELLLAEHRRDRDPERATTAQRLLGRLRTSAETSGHDATLLDVLVLDAIAAAQTGAEPAPALLAALALAEPEGAVRPFARHGSLLAGPLELVVHSRADPGFARQVVASCGTPRPLREPEQTAAGAALASQGLVDPLTERELQVLRLLDTDLTGPEIARHLFVSLNTVRTHTKNLFTKLDVTSRRGAVRRGQDLGLLDRS